ncbi:MAG: tRNA 2-thiouridine(34) synthase MnmA [Treponema sp.]|jgi:tRNA-specific 2-thiouridylase|nr:tRNA 2-thiouridine(34) synthase MnmA [Treponema sp.]
MHGFPGGGRVLTKGPPLRGTDPLKPAEKKAVIAMSGGVDSSVAAALMREAGFRCIGVTMKLFSGESRCCSLADVNDARNVAFNLGIPHYVLNFTDEFGDRVIRRFVETYERGETPNPCIDCNRFIKFNLLLLRARQIDFDYLVTGHYARIEEDAGGGRFLLRKALDTKKDQSYVLYCLTQEQLRALRFPLGGLTKEAVRRMAAERRFINAGKRDSQDICFVPAGNYGAFIEDYRGRRAAEGDIIGIDGRRLGRHRGLVRCTIGQRRGLGVAAGEPLYVTAKSTVDNTVTLGPEQSLYTRSLDARDLNLIACERIEGPLRVTVKTRYLQKEQAALAEQTGEDRLHLEFNEPQRALTPGQAAVLYDGDYVVGGGTIC